MKRTWSTVLDKNGLQTIQDKYGNQSIRPGFQITGAVHTITGTEMKFVVLYEKGCSTTKHQTPDLSEQGLIEDLETHSLIDQVFLNAQTIARQT